jgi:hypothetical protein
MSRGVVLLGEAAYRRLTTKRGQLRGGPEEENYGIDLLEYIGASNPKRAAAQLPGVIQNELLRDERFASAVATVTVIDDSELDIAIEIEASDGTSFTLRLGVSDVTVQLLGIEP